MRVCVTKERPIFKEGAHDRTLSKTVIGNISSISRSLLLLCYAIFLFLQIIGQI